MTRSLALLVIATLASGCSTYGGSKRTAKVGAVTTIVGLASTAIAITMSSSDSGIVGPSAVGAFAGTIGGAMLMTGGLVGMEIHDPETITRPVERPAHAADFSARPAATLAAGR